MRGSPGVFVAGALLLAGACGDDAWVPPLPIAHLASPEESPDDGDSMPAPGPVAPYRGAAVLETGTIVGRVRFRATRPGLLPFDVARQHHVCGQSQPNPVFAVGPAGGFADVVVWLDVDEGAHQAAHENALEAMEHRQEAADSALYPCIVLAQVHIARTELDEARSVLDTAWRENPQPLHQADLHGCKALLAATQGDRATYDRHLNAIAQWPQLGQPDSPLGRVLARAAVVIICVDHAEGQSQLRTVEDL